MRRGMRHSHLLGSKEPIFYNIFKTLMDEMSGNYPEIKRAEALIKETLKMEEEKFLTLLDRGMKILDEEISNIDKILPGEVAFKLYDTYGFPLDLTQLLAKERNLSVQVKAFDLLMDKQKDKARDTNKFLNIEEKNDWKILSKVQKNSTFLGYNDYESNSNISMYRLRKDKIELVLNQTPFYAESGGQTGDTGFIESDDFIFRVEDTYKDGDYICHLGYVQKGSIKESHDKQLKSKVDVARREKIKNNHTSTHLLHKALKIVLGEHVQQAGSLVSEDKLRFDLTHYQKITIQELNEVENILFKESLISSYSSDEFIILFACNLPFCLGPMFKLGVPNDGASIMPLEELPTSTSEIFINERYNC